MQTANLLVLATLLSLPAVASSSPGNSPDTTSATAVHAGAPTGNVGQAFELTAPRQSQDDIVTPSDDVCYRIRAYIFKRDDDHAPVFVRSTTCGPRKPHTQGIAWPKARLVPAK